MNLTREQLVELILTNSRDLRAADGENLPEPAEDLRETMANLENDPAAAVMLERLAGLLWQAGYDHAVATTFPNFGSANRATVASEGVNELRYSFKTPGQLDAAVKEWRDFVLGGRQ